MRTHIFLMLALIGLSPSAAFADGHETECPLSYEVFEAAVPHTDMEECPTSLEAGEDAFCRVSVVAEVATVFLFSYDTGCLVKTQSFYEDEYTFIIE